MNAQGIRIRIKMLLNWRFQNDQWIWNEDNDTSATQEEMSRGYGRSESCVWQESKSQEGPEIQGAARKSRMFVITGTDGEKAEGARMYGLSVQLES